MVSSICVLLHSASNHLVTSYIWTLLKIVCFVTHVHTLVEDFSWTIGQRKEQNLQAEIHKSRRFVILEAEEVIKNVMLLGKSQFKCMSGKVHFMFNMFLHQRAVFVITVYMIAPLSNQKRNLYVNQPICTWGEGLIGKHVFLPACFPPFIHQFWWTSP